jgi:hypothetical protein
MRQIATAAVALAASAGAAFAQCASVESKVCTLKTGWAENTKPECDGTVPAEAQVVQSAFKLAHPSLQREFCALSKILITDGDSFAVWLNPALGQTPNGEPPESFVGVNRDTITKSLAEIEDASLNRTLKGESKLAPSHKVSSPNPEYAVLGVLAREVGRVKWHRDNIYSSLHCYWSAFVDESWYRKNMGEFMKRAWAPSFDKPEAREDANKAASEYNKRNLRHSHAENLSWSDIQKSYNEFATLVGGVSPEEDFVEAYKVVALAKATSPVTLSLNHAGAAISANPTTSHVVQKKLACVGDNLMPAPVTPIRPPPVASARPSPATPPVPEHRARAVPTARVMNAPETR